MSDTIYCYPDSDVLINKLDIRELDKLHTFERKLTMLRLLELMDKPISGKFDFKHLQAIHRYIFQDVYDWAGKVRTVDIAKGNMFCNVRLLWSSIFVTLVAKKYLVPAMSPSLHVEWHNHYNYAGAHNCIQHMQSHLLPGRELLPFQTHTDWCTHFSMC